MAAITCIETNILKLINLAYVCYELSLIATPDEVSNYVQKLILRCPPPDGKLVTAKTVVA